MFAFSHDAASLNLQFTSFHHASNFVGSACICIKLTWLPTVVVLNPPTSQFTLIYLNDIFYLGIHLVDALYSRKEHGEVGMSAHT